jgi:hypothetical protein
MPDEYAPRLGIANKEPPIPVRTAVKLSSFQRHRLLLAWPGARDDETFAQTQNVCLEGYDGFVTFGGAALNRVGFVGKLDGPDAQLLDHLWFDGGL